MSRHVTREKPTLVYVIACWRQEIVAIWRHLATIRKTATECSQLLSTEIQNQGLVRARN